jgi:hypothetical protein
MYYLIILMVLSIGVSQELGKWRWANDTSEFTMDKEAHFVGSAGAYFFFRHKEYTPRESILYSFYLGLGKECIDALLPYEEYGRWGGDGFSKYDLYYNVAGIGLSYIIDSVWKPKDENLLVSIYKNNFNIFYRFGF